jgi:Zn-finger protein
MVKKQMGRRRQINNAELPIGLYSRMVRGKLRYYYRNSAGKDTYFPENCPLSAIKESVLEFNEKNRSGGERIKSCADKYNVRIANVWSEIKRNLDEENEGKAKSTLETFENDCKRFVEFFGNYLTKEVSLEEVNEYLQTYHSDASFNVRNRKIRFLQAVFSEFTDMSYMSRNCANDKKIKKKLKKAKTKAPVRISRYALMMMLNKAEPFMKTAIKLSLQTCHAVNEIVNLKYSDCHYFSEPQVYCADTETYFAADETTSSDVRVHGMIWISREKNQHSAASKVEIPITNEMMETIKASVRDLGETFTKGVEPSCPFIIHKKKRYQNVNNSYGFEHPWQLKSDYLSKQFSKLRDLMDFYLDIEDRKQRPGFHEIRSLAIFLHDKQSKDEKSTMNRAAHSDLRMTHRYKEGHEKFKRVPPSTVTL